MTLGRRFSLPLAMVFAVSCVDLSTGPGTVKPELELALGEIGAASVAFEPADLAILLGAVHRPFPSIVGPASACPLDSATTLFTCAEVSILGANNYVTSLRRSYQLLSSGGQPLTAYDKNTAAAIRVIHDRDVSGNISKGTTGEFLAYLDTTHNDFTVSGLLTGTRVINGSGNTRAVFTDAGVSTFGVATYTMANVALPLRTPGNTLYNFPNSGVVTNTVVVSGAGVVTDTVTVQVTFTGNNSASYTRTHGGVTKQGTCYRNVSRSQADGGCSLPQP